MLRKRLRLLALGAFAVLGLAAHAGCQGDAELQLCGEIPAGGCPIGRGGTCEDVSCTALYDCEQGKWTQVDLCPSTNGGSGGGDAGSDAYAGCFPADLPDGGGGTKCHPDLELPDCPVEAAEACPDSICTTGCTDFFACSSDGWVAVAYCDEEGHIVTSP